MRDWRELRNHILREDSETRRDYEQLGPLYAVIADMLRLRQEKGLSQRDLAARMGKQQPAIARFEAGNTNPSLSFLQELAEALEVQLTVRLQPLMEPAEKTKRVADGSSSYPAT